MLPKRLRLNLRWDAPARWRFVPIREVRVAKIIFCRRMFVLGLCCISSQSSCGYRRNSHPVRAGRSFVAAALRAP